MSPHNYQLKLPTSIAAALALFVIINTSSFAADDNDAAALIAQNCMACHGGDETMENRLAPPFVAVKQHYLGQHAEKEAFVAALASWVKEPDESKTLMKGAVRKFGLMSAVELTDEQLSTIAEYLFDMDLEKPDWFDEHYKAEHGEEKPKQ